MINDLDVLTVSRKLLFACTAALGGYLTKAEDEVPCFTYQRNELIVPDFSNPCSGLTYLQPAQNCHNSWLHLMWNLRSKFWPFPLSDLAPYVRNQLSQPKTALLTSEYFLPVIWKEFERAMKEDRNLKFSHNYYSPGDTTLTNRGSRLLITAGVNYE